MRKTTLLDILRSMLIGLRQEIENTTKRIRANEMDDVGFDHDFTLMQMSTDVMEYLIENYPLFIVDVDDGTRILGVSSRCLRESAHDLHDIMSNVSCRNDFLERSNVVLGIVLEMEKVLETFHDTDVELIVDDSVSNW